MADTETQPGPAEPGRRTAAHLFSVDVEEYFQVEAAARSVPPEQWDSFPPRAAPCVDRLCRRLADHGATATFFVLGWVARRQPDMIRRIAAAGHEIASHGMTHRMLERLGPEGFARELAESRDLLGELSGRPVVGFRAPTFSITHRTAWAIDVLAEAGFLYDSSIFPVRHDRYGVPEAPRTPHRAVGPAGGAILEIPPMTARLFGANWPLGGGGYLRLLPVGLFERELERHARAGRPGMLYVHPWEFDPDQPPLPMSRPARWRHRVGLARAEGKLVRLLRGFRFTSVQAMLNRLRASADLSFRYGPPGPAD